MKKWFLLLTLSLLPLLAHASPLPANEVFKLTVKKVDPNTFNLNWDIKAGYFLYSDRIIIKEQAKESLIHIGSIRFPAPLSKTDNHGRIYQIYRNQLSLAIPVLGEQAGETLIDVHYQGCSDEGFCYPPETRQVKVSIRGDLALADVSLEGTNNVAVNSLPEAITPASVFSSHHWTMVLLIFYGLGLLLAFTPCVLPMIPVLSGIIVGHGSDLTTRKAFLLSLSYVLSMAFTYAIVGAIAASLGSNLQMIMQAPWAIALFSLLFVLLALSMFGFFELSLPSNWQNKLSGISRSQSSGHYLSAAVMGFLSTLILSPCVTAPLIGVLSYIARTGDIFFGWITLLILGLGMGTPLLLIGTSAGQWLPKAGNWMGAVKSFFGVLLLAVAIYLSSRILPDIVTMLMWASLLVFSGIYAGALLPARTTQQKCGQSLGILLFVYGLLILVGGSMGSTNPMQPLTGMFNLPASVEKLPAIKVKTLAEIEKAIKNTKKPVMIDFYADWCVSCQVMESSTLADPRVLNVLKDFNVLKVDLTENNQDNKAIMSHFNVIAPPTFLFFSAQGQALETLTLVGEVSTEDFLNQLQKVQRAE